MITVTGCEVGPENVFRILLRDTAGTKSDAQVPTKIRRILLTALQQEVLELLEEAGHALDDAMTDRDDHIELIRRIDKFLDGTRGPQ